MAKLNLYDRLGAAPLMKQFTSVYDQVQLRSAYVSIL